MNPEIVSVDGEQFEDEGCLSVPGFTSAVVRPKTVIIKGLDLNGKEDHRRRQGSSRSRLLPRNGSPERRVLPRPSQLHQARHHQAEDSQAGEAGRVGAITTPAATRIVFAGTSSFAVPILQTVIRGGVPDPRRRNAAGQTCGQGQSLQPPPVKSRALELGLAGPSARFFEER